MSKKILSEIIGWLGIAAVMLAYVLVSFNIIKATGLPYQLLNLVGAAGIIVISVVKGIRQTVALNIFWGLIALVAIARIISQ